MRRADRLFQIVLMLGRGKIQTARTIAERLEDRNAEGASTERIIWPLSLAYWGRTWTVGGWCELRQAFRNFRLDRISTLRTLSSKFPSEPGKRLEDYLQQTR